MAYASVETRLALALVCIHLTPGPLVAWQASAGKEPDVVAAGCAIPAWIRVTLIYIHLAVHALVAKGKRITH